MNRKPRLTTVTGALALALTLTLAACGDTAEETPAPAGTAGEATSPMTTEDTTQTTQGEVDEAHNDADTQFAQMMIVHHEGAIEMADLAVQNAASEQVRTLAEGISKAQGPEIEQMTSWLQAWGEETSPTGGMGGMDHGDMDMGSMEMDGMNQQEAMAELESLSGTEFDRRFLELMVAHHRGAVQMAQTELDNGQNPQALQLAQQIIDDQQTEIAEMERMLQDL